MTKPPRFRMRAPTSGRDPVRFRQSFRSVAESIADSVSTGVYKGGLTLRNLGARRSFAIRNVSRSERPFFARQRNKSGAGFLVSVRIMADRFQFVWWGLGVWRLPRFMRWRGSLRSIYRWSLLCGPFEVRRWENKRPLMSERRDSSA